MRIVRWRRVGPRSPHRNRVEEHGNCLQFTAGSKSETAFEDTHASDKSSITESPVKSGPEASMRSYLPRGQLSRSQRRPCDIAQILTAGAAPAAGGAAPAAGGAAPAAGGAGGGPGGGPVGTTWPMSRRHSGQVRSPPAASPRWTC